MNRWKRFGYILTSSANEHYRCVVHFALCCSLSFVFIFFSFTLLFVHIRSVFVYLWAHSLSAITRLRYTYTHTHTVLCALPLFCIVYLFIVGMCVRETVGIGLTVTVQPLLLGNNKNGNRLTGVRHSTT